MRNPFSIYWLWVTRKKKWITYDSRSSERTNTFIWQLQNAIENHIYVLFSVPNILPTNQTAFVTSFSYIWRISSICVIWKIQSRRIMSCWDKYRKNWHFLHKYFPNFTSWKFLSLIWEFIRKSNKNVNAAFFIIIFISFWILYNFSNTNSCQVCSFFYSTRTLFMMSLHWFFL